MSGPTHNIIVMWSGATTDIPEGWKLCDGYNNTPDLTNKFIIGAGNTYDPSDTDGASEHTHDFTTTGHNHTMPAGNDINAGNDFNALSSGADSTGTTNPQDTEPPYYALAYIKKN